MSETGEGKKLDEALVKLATGGDTITARFLHQEFFSYTPQFKLSLATNHRPTITGTDNAIWDRIRLIPFSVTIPESERDRDLKAKLKAEADGIFAWMVQGCMEWQRDGLGIVDDVRLATADYRADMDSLATFIDDACIVAEGVSCGAAELHTAYVAWAKANGVDSVNQTVFGRTLTGRGFVTDRHPVTRRKIRRGLGLRVEDRP